MTVPPGMGGNRRPLGGDGHGGGEGSVLDVECRWCASWHCGIQTMWDVGCGFSDVDIVGCGNRDVQAMGVLRCKHGMWDVGCSCFTNYDVVCTH